MLEVFRELAAMGKAVIISSHHMADLVDVCDRIAVMAAGQITSVGTVPELIRELEVAQRVRLAVLGDEDLAQRILSQTPYVTDIEVSRTSFTFTCGGGRAAQALLVQELVRAGVKVVQFAPANQPLHDLLAGATKTPVSPDQYKP
jgi:ABC-2 type transport system ATP-binding protein